MIELSEVWIQLHGRLRGLGTVPAVVDLDTDAAFHRIDELVEIIPVRRDGFEQDPLLDRLALGQDAVHRQGGEHPVLDGVLLQHLLVEDVVPESVLPVTFDDDSEHVEDGVPVAVEGAAGDRNTLAQRGIEPALVDFFECQAAETMDSVHQPDIFLEECVGFHRTKIYLFQR